MELDRTRRTWPGSLLMCDDALHGLTHHAMPFSSVLFVMPSIYYFTMVCL